MRPVHLWWFQPRRRAAPGHPVIFVRPLSAPARAALSRRQDGAGGPRSPPHRREQQQHRGRIKQNRDNQDEPAQDVLVVGADQRRQVPDGAQVGLCYPLIAVNLGLLDLEVGKDLVRLVALGGELCPVPALVVGQPHGAGCAAARCGGVDRLVYLADAAVKVRHQIGLNGHAPIDAGAAAGNCNVSLDLVPDMRLRQEAVAADGVEAHQEPGPARRAPP